MEHIASFLDLNFNRAFNVEMAGITYPDENYAINRSNSTIFCLEYVIEGEGIVTVDSQTVYPKKGDIYILPKGHNHRYKANPQNPYKKIWMNVCGNLCDALFAVYHLEGVVLVKDLNLYPLFLLFLETCEDQNHTVDEIFSKCSIIFHEIMMKINAHLFYQKHQKPSIASNIKDYINRHIYEKLDIAQLAGFCFLSPSQITRLFNKSYGISPYDYILTQKIETAKLLLRNTPLSIKEIAHKLHFSDEHYFSNVFTKKVGCRPSIFVKIDINK